MNSTTSWLAATTDDAITYGVDYSGAVISPFTEAEGMQQPLQYWVPSISPRASPSIVVICSPSGGVIYCSLTHQ